MRSPCLFFACLLASFVTTFGSSPVKAQLTPDTTLGAQSSTVNSDAIVVDGNLIDLIEGGTTKGKNLFHSFLDFNVSEDKQVYFDSPAGIETILSRVTGSNLSAIDGLLGTTGSSDAALILMNPNGIVFGENATLDTQGAFTATTATSIHLGEEGLFSAIAPDSDNLLSINPSAFFFTGLAAKAPEVLVKSRSGLSVPEGEALSFLGGDIVFDGGRVVAPGSRVELSAAGATSAIAIAEDGSSVLLSGDKRGDVRLENASSINVVDGELAISAQDIQILSDTDLLTGSRAGRIRSESQASLIRLDASEQIQIAGSGTVVGSTVERGSLEQGGDITLSARDIEVRDGSTIGAITLGNGDSGNIVITATDVVALGAIDSNRTSIFTSVEENSTGQGGNIEISTANFEAAEEIYISTGTFGSGDAGDIRIEASESALFGSVVGNGVLLIDALTGRESTGEGGDIAITATNVEVNNGARITTGTLGKANAGNLTLRASENIQIDGFNANRDGFNSSVGSFANSQTGRPGNVEVSATNLEVVRGGIISSSTAGDGNAGVVRIDVAETARFDGVGSYSRGLILSGARSSGSQIGSGRGGKIELSATELEVTNGAQILATSRGEGDAGDISVAVSKNVRISGINSVDARVPSGIGSDVFATGTGEGGKIDITATDIELTDGAFISSSVSGRGDAGSVVLNALETVRVDGVNPITGNSPTSVSSSIDLGGEGRGGRVEIAAANLEITNGGSVSTSVFGKGDAGDVLIDVSKTVLVDGANLITGIGASSISSSLNEGAEGRGGNVTINAASLNVTNGGQVATSSFGQGNAGTIKVDVSRDIVVSGFNQLRGDDIFPSSITSSVERAGSGGDVRIESANLEVSNKADIAAFSIGEGDAGFIQLDADGQILIEDDSDIVTLSRFNSGGQIDIKANGVILRNDGNIRTSVTSNEGRGGNITIDADYLVALNDSDVLSFSKDGRGGNIDLMQTALFSESLTPIDESLSQDALLELNQNNRVDINATGGITSGQILIANTNFVENNLAELPDSLVDTEALIANACVARSDGTNGTLVLRDSDRHTQTPTTPLLNTYSTNTVQPIISQPAALQEPQGVYQLANGRTVISHRCKQ